MHRKQRVKQKGARGSAGKAERELEAARLPDHHFAEDHLSEHHDIAPSGPVARSGRVAETVAAAPLATCLASFAVGAGIGALAMYAVGRGTTASHPFWSQLGHQAWTAIAKLLPQGVQDTMDAAKDWGKTHGA